MKREPNDVTKGLLLALCRGELDDTTRAAIIGLLAQPVDWDELAELAALHGVVGLVRRNLVALEARESIPAAVWQRIQNAASQIAFDGMLHIRQLAQVTAALRSLGVEPVALKGVGLADLLYGDPTIRPSADLDLLVDLADLPGALNALTGLGAQIPARGEIEFQSQYSYDLGCTLPPVAGKATLVELHWNLAPRNLFDLDLQVWRNRAQSFRLDENTGLRFAPEEQLLHLALHMRKHRYVGLRWLVDVAELLRRFAADLDWRHVDGTARRAGLQTLLFVTVTLAGQYFDAPCPGDWLERWTPSPARRRLLASVLAQDALLAPLEMEDAGWTRLAPAEVLLLDKPAAMARELRYRLFPPAEALTGRGADGARPGQRVTLYASRLAHRTATLLRRSS